MNVSDSRTPRRSVSLPMDGMGGLWPELNCRDVQSAMRFYGAVMGWRFESLAMPDGSTYHVALSDDRPACGLFEIVPERHGDLPDHWMTYGCVTDIDAVLRATRQTGGEVLRPAFYIPALGHLALLADASGALFGVLAPECERSAASSHDAWHAGSISVMQRA